MRGHDTCLSGLCDNPDKNSSPRTTWFILLLITRSGKGVHSSEKGAMLSPAGRGVTPAVGFHPRRAAVEHTCGWDVQPLESAHGRETCRCTDTGLVLTFARLCANRFFGARVCSNTRGESWSCGWSTWTAPQKSTRKPSFSSWSV